MATEHGEMRSKRDRMDREGAWNLIGIQIGAISFVDEGVEACLDTLQEKAGVNTLFLSALSWSRGNAGRATVKFPDHGKAEPDAFTGGAFWEPDPKCYKNSILFPTKCPDPEYHGFDVLANVIPAAKRRGMRVMPYYCETPRSTIRHTNVPNAAQAVEVDIFGRKSTRPCHNNPLYKSWVFSIVEDWFRNHDLDGLMWGIERQSGLKGLLSGEPATCFCDHCLRKAAALGIDSQRARKGYLKLHEFRERIKGGYKPVDGYFLEFIRIILEYPEVLSWEKFWLDSHRAFHRELAGLVKYIDPALQVGFSIWQEITSFSPYLRAQYNYTEFKDYADFIKPIVYHVPAGARFARYVKYLQPLLFHKGGLDEEKLVDMTENVVLRDFSDAEALGLFYRLLGLQEAPLTELPQKGFSVEYVRTETARAVSQVGPLVKVYPGIDAGVPGGPGSRETEPDDVYRAVLAAYEGGATGIILSRNYAEMNLANLEAAGRALKELGVL